MHNYRKIENIMKSITDRLKKKINIDEILCSLNDESVILFIGKTLESIELYSLNNGLKIFERVLSKDAVLGITYEKSLGFKHNDTFSFITSKEFSKAAGITEYWSDYISDKFVILFDKNIQVSFIDFLNIGQCLESNINIFRKLKYSGFDINKYKINEEQQLLYESL